MHLSHSREAVWRSESRVAIRSPDHPSRLASLAPQDDGFGVSRQPHPEERRESDASRRMGRCFVSFMRYDFAGIAFEQSKTKRRTTSGDTALSSEANATAD